MSLREDTALERTQELFKFLQGTSPDDYHVAPRSMPRLSPSQAWTVIWYLGNQYWQVPDHIERCDVCGTLYDSHNAGDCLDYGRPPYSFCDDCMEDEKYAKKLKRRGRQK